MDPTSDYDFLIVEISPMGFVPHMELSGFLRHVLVILVFDLL